MNKQLTAGCYILLVLISILDEHEGFFMGGLCSRVRSSVVLSMGTISAAPCRLGVPL